MTQLVPIDLQSEGKLGPAMAALSPLMQRFVVALVQTGCSNARAAALAGYTGSPDTLKATGHRLAHDARVQAAIYEEAQKLIRSSAPMAIGVLTEIAAGSYYEPKDRLKAAVALLDRSGLGAATTHTVKVEHTVSEQDQIAHIRQMATQLGLDPVKLLGNAGHIVDAEFTEVTPADDIWTVEPEDKSNGPT